MDWGVLVAIAGGVSAVVAAIAALRREIGAWIPGVRRLVLRFRHRGQIADEVSDNLQTQQAAALWTFTNSVEEATATLAELEGLVRIPDEPSAGWLDTKAIRKLARRSGQSVKRVRQDAKYVGTRFPAGAETAENALATVHHVEGAWQEIRLLLPQGGGISDGPERTARQERALKELKEAQRCLVSTRHVARGEASADAD